MPQGIWLVVGLGNPGPTYAFHRHNIGHLVIDELARRAGSPLTPARGKRADTCRSRVGPDAAVVVKPRTYMNESGAPVAALMAYYKVMPENLVVLHDELDLELGRLRLKIGGGDNGHNGLRSIRKALGTGDYHRVRIGIGRPPGRQEPADYVLSNFSAGQRDEVAIQVARAADAVEALIADGLSSAQNRFNN